MAAWSGVVHADEADSLEEGDRESLDEQDEGELDPVRPFTTDAAHPPARSCAFGQRSALAQWSAGDCQYAAQDSMTYEQLCALGDAVGTHSRGDPPLSFCSCSERPA